jgi:hypothetical protein
MRFSSIHISLFLLSWQASGTVAKLYERAEDLPKTNYDFIIVGGTIPLETSLQTLTKEMHMLQAGLRAVSF